MTDSAFQDFGSERFVRRLGRIDEVHFGIEDHGLFGFHIGIDHGGSYSGTGWLTSSKNELATNGRIAFLQMTLLEAMKVDDWARLKGQVVWALFDKADPWNSPVRGLQQPEFAGSGVWVIGDIAEVCRNVRQHFQNEAIVRARQDVRKSIKREDVEKVVAGAEAMLLQGADTEISREWAEEIVADVLKLAGAVVEP